MKKLAAVLALAAAAACAPEGSRSSAVILPPNFKTAALRPVTNQTQQYGIEDALMNDIRDEFLKDGTVPIVSEDKADGVVVTTLTRYLFMPVQYDANLNPTAYKLDVRADLKFLDRATGKPLWDERDMDVFDVYPAPNLSGGLSEQQAQAQLWDELARDIVTRVAQGFGRRGPR